MKKAVSFIILVLSTLALMLAGCGGSGMSLEVKPEDTTLEYWILDEVGEEGPGIRINEDTEPSSYLARGYEPLSYDEKGYVKKLPEEYVRYEVYPYPTGSDKKKIISIIITDPKISMYGITLNSSKADFEKAFKAMGCEIAVSDTPNGDSHIGAMKGNIHVNLAKLADGGGYIAIMVSVGFDD